MSEFASSGMTAALTALPTLSAEMMTLENFMSMCVCFVVNMSFESEIG
jgi:hypothetical protein